MSGGVGSLVVDRNQMANYPPSIGDGLYAKLTEGADKEPVRVASAASIANLSSVTVANFDGTGQGVTLVQGDRVLVKDTASKDGVESVAAKRNGIYVTGVVTSGTAALTRDVDLSSSLMANCGANVYVCEGTNAGKFYCLTTVNPIVLDTTAQTWGAIALTAGLVAPIVPIDLKGAILAAGTPLVPFVAATSVGYNIDGTAPKALVIRWPAGVATVVWNEVDLPTDLDPTYPATLHILTAKSGATATDVVSWTVTAFAQTVGALEDAGSNLGGVSPALTSGQAALPAKTITDLQIPIFLPPTPPARLSISLAPSGTDVTDDVSCCGLFLQYVPRAATPRVLIDLRDAILAAGTPMAAFADNAASNPGVTLDNSKAVGIRWNDNATQTAIWSYMEVPPDLDVTKPCVLVALESKSGATGGDTFTNTVTIFAQTPGALEDAGSNLGGTSTAIAAPTASAKTVAKVTLGIAPNTLPAYPARLSISIKPTNGTLGTDDGVNNGLWLEYQKKTTSNGIVPFDMKAALLANGTAMAAFTDNAASQPGITLDNSKAVGVRWNDAATQVAVFTQGALPLDMDVTQPSTVVVMASKSGATLADATTFDVALFEQPPGSLEDAGPTFSGTTSALVGSAAAKTVGQLSLAVPGSTFSAAPGQLTVSIKPTNGTLSTDDAICNGFWLLYTKKAAA